MARKPKLNKGREICITIAPKYLSMFSRIPTDIDFITKKPKNGRRNAHIEQALDAYFKKHYSVLWEEVCKECLDN